MPDPDDQIPEDQIRARSYAIWQREHCPPGRQMEHWFRAKAELRSERLRAVRHGELPNGQGGSVYFWDHFG